MKPPRWKMLLAAMGATSVLGGGVAATPAPAEEQPTEQPVEVEEAPTASVAERLEEVVHRSVVLSENEPDRPTSVIAWPTENGYRVQGVTNQATAQGFNDPNSPERPLTVDVRSVRELGDPLLPVMNYVDFDRADAASLPLATHAGEVGAVAYQFHHQGPVSLGGDPVQDPGAFYDPARAGVSVNNYGGGEEGVLVGSRMLGLQFGHLFEPSAETEAYRPADYDAIELLGKLLAAGGVMIDPENGNANVGFSSRLYVRRKEAREYGGVYRVTSLPVNPATGESDLGYFTAELEMSWDPETGRIDRRVPMEVVESTVNRTDFLGASIALRPQPDGQAYSLFSADGFSPVGVGLQANSTNIADLDLLETGPLRNVRLE